MGLIALMMYALKKVSHYYQKGDSKFLNKHIKIIETAYLTKDRQLIIVELYDKKYFLGVGEGSFTLIKELDLKDE